MTLSIAGLCEGYGGLTMAVKDALGGGEVAWVAEYDDAPSRLLAHHWPHIPNHRDLTTIDWTTVDPVDVIAAGWPCQPWALCGLGLGVDDPRHLWPHIALGHHSHPGALAILRPRMFIGENVLGHLSRGFADVVADLHRLDYDTWWTVRNASDVGAPHRQPRLFVLAVRRDAPTRSPRDGTLLARHDTALGWVEPEAGLFGAHPYTVTFPTSGAQISGEVFEIHAPPPVEARFPLLPTPKASDGERGNCPAEAARNSPSLVAISSLLRTGPRSRSVRPAGVDGPALVALDAAQPTMGEWGVYEPAIRRWECALTRPAPVPYRVTVRGGEQLAPEFPEWMMGVPEGHICGVPGLTRAEKIKLAGNGVHPGQGAAAIRWLLDRAAGTSSSAAA